MGFEVFEPMHRHQSDPTLASLSTRPPLPWEDWLAYVAASINSRVCESTGQSPHHIIFVVEKRLPYDLLSSSHSRVINIDDHAKSQFKVFSDIHSNVRERL